MLSVPRAVAAAEIESVEREAVNESMDINIVGSCLAL
jgi:hypothetical protein